MTVRRLAAILAADVAGFSAMMERDEEGTAAQIRALRRDVIEPLLSRHHGRLVKTTGDGFLAEFASPVEAVRAALAMQEQLATDELRLRIGINLGDIIIEDDGDVFGDGVNVAARLEQIAEPRGICISGKIYAEVEGKIDREFEDRGEQQVKNIARPVRVYAVCERVSAEPQPIALPLPDKPSIAVLPFANMSGDPEQEYFADGIVEDIITALSRFRNLFVIARNSSFTYRDRAIDVKQIGRELGVRYILEGSVRKGGDRLRISGRLVSGEDNTTIWADRFDGHLDELFALQDTVAAGVVAALEPNLRKAELIRSESRPKAQLNAYDLLLRANQQSNLLTRESNQRAIEFLQQAIAIDPHFALAQAYIAFCHARNLWQDWSQNREEDERSAIKFAKAALDGDSSDPEVLWRSASCLSRMGGELQTCMALSDRSIELNPNSAQALIHGAWIRLYAGYFEEAIQQLEHARRLNPLDPAIYGCTTGLATAHFHLGNFELAVRLCNQSLAQNSRFVATHRVLASALAYLGMGAEAKRVVSDILLLAPNTTISSTMSQRMPSVLKGPSILNGLRLAGLPE